MEDLNKRYNIHLKKIIIKDDGQKFCPKCNGKGRVTTGKEFQIRRLFNRSLVCDKCLGDGIFDWIEQATGKKPKERRYARGRARATGPR